MREDRKRGAFVPGAADVLVRTEDQVLDALWRGARNRAMHATEMNDTSSRSHTIFQVSLELVTLPAGEGGSKVRAGGARGGEEHA
jgi:centromeric protein E